MFTITPPPHDLGAACALIKSPPAGYPEDLGAARRYQVSASVLRHRSQRVMPYANHFLMSIPPLPHSALHTGRDMKRISICMCAREAMNRGTDPVYVQWVLGIAARTTWYI